MKEDSRKSTEKLGLLPVLLSLVEKCQASYRQKRVSNRVLGLVMAEIFAFGRHTITQLLCVLGLTEKIGMRGIASSVWGVLMTQRRVQ